MGHSGRPISLDVQLHFSMVKHVTGIHDQFFMRSNMLMSQTGQIDKSLWVQYSSPTYLIS